jgi:hypothetical protein
LPIDQDYLPQAVSCSLRPDVIEKAELYEILTINKFYFARNPNARPAKTSFTIPIKLEE